MDRAFPRDRAPTLVSERRGHFENLGAYELIRRRIPLIVVVDGEMDPDFEFNGLGDAVRKARVDFGAEIEFLDQSRMASRWAAALSDSSTVSPMVKPLLNRLSQLRPSSARSAPGAAEAQLSPGEEPGAALSPAHAALALVRYREPGKGSPQASLLVYVKATLTGDEPRDLLTYKKRTPSSRTSPRPTNSSTKPSGKATGSSVCTSGVRFAP